LHRPENQADHIAKNLIGELFERETNAIEPRRWK
jgi:hypothetical protein